MQTSYLLAGSSFTVLVLYLLVPVLIEFGNVIICYFTLRYVITFITPDFLHLYVRTGNTLLNCETIFDLLSFGILMN